MYKNLNWYGNGLFYNRKLINQGKYYKIRKLEFKIIIRKW
jgi:hypothetical protein